MSINMFSKIKIRRGLQIDLPDLDKGEFGFTTDTGEIFIGAPDLPSLVGKGRGESGEEFPYKNIQILSSINSHASIQKYTLKGNDGPEGHARRTQTPRGMRGTRHGALRAGGHPWPGF